MAKIWSERRKCAVARKRDRYWTCVQEQPGGAAIGSKRAAVEEKIGGPRGGYLDSVAARKMARHRRGRAPDRNRASAIVEDEQATVEQWPDDGSVAGIGHRTALAPQYYRLKAWKST